MLKAPRPSHDRLDRLILKEQFTSRAEGDNGLPASTLSIALLDPVRHGNAPQPGSLSFEVLLDALEATDTP